MAWRKMRESVPAEQDFENGRHVLEYGLVDEACHILEYGLIAFDNLVQHFTLGQSLSDM